MIKKGDLVSNYGYEGRVTKLHQGAMSGMVDVLLDAGHVCVPAANCRLVRRNAPTGSTPAAGACIEVPQTNERSAMIKDIKGRVRRSGRSEDVCCAMASYLLHLDLYPSDYEGATQEAAYDLEVGDEAEFKEALREVGTWKASEPDESASV